MSEDEDDLYDDEDDSIFEDEGEGDESEGDYDDVENGEDDDDDLYDEGDEEFEDDIYEEDEEDEDYDEGEEDDYDEEGLSSEGSCFVCSVDGDEVPEDARWKFAVADEGGRVELWACRSCREKFKSLEDFEDFRTNWTRSQLYRCAARLQRLILLKAPDCLIANTVFVMAGAMFTDYAEGLRPPAVEELKKLKDRVGGEG